MKELFFILLFFINIFVYSQQPNDCVNRIQVCGNSQISLDVSGFGVQEIADNACDSQEHNSLWLRVTIETGGTLGFDLIPQGTNINEDYDFWVFGPHPQCSALNSAIRCSTTNPEAAGQANNHTGMNGTETDTSEGPGPAGNSYVKWLDVLPGESYFIVIDRPIGNSAFTLNWSGTAVITNPFSEEEFGEFSPIELCDYADDGSENFDFSTLSVDYMAGRANFTISYHNTLDDAVLGNNDITSPISITTKSYYARIEHTQSSCFETREILVKITPVVVAPKIINVCDDDDDGNVTINLSTLTFEVSPTATYSFSFFENSFNANALTPTNALTGNYTTSQDGKILYVRAQDGSCYGVGTLTIHIIPPLEVDNKTEIVCDENWDGILTYDLTQYESEIYTGNPTVTFSYFNSFSNANNNTYAISNPSSVSLASGNNTYYVRVSNLACYSIATIQLNLVIKPNLGSDETVKFCLEENGILLSVPTGFSSYLWNNDSTLNTNTLLATTVGTYSIKVTNSIGCEDEKIFTVELYPSPIISVDVEQNSANIIATGSLEMIYSIDDGATWSEFHTFTNLPSGIYLARAKYENGCLSNPFKFIMLDYVNSFTPNGDGINDIWIIKYLDAYEDATIAIFDKYGKSLVSKKVTELFTWDGKYLGRSLPSDTYWYSIELPNGKKIQGWVFLKNR